MPKSYTAPSREGLVPVAVFVRPDIRQELKIAAARHGTTVAAIMEDAVSYALKKYGAKR